MKIGSFIFGTFPTLQLYDNSGYYFPFKIILYAKNGGDIKRQWFIGQESNITSFDCEINKLGSAVGNISFSKLDFQIDKDDRLEFWLKNEKIYQGYVESIPDPKGGQVRLEPIRKKLKDTLYNGAFTSKTPNYILKSVLDSVQNQTNIYYNASMIDDVFKNYTTVMTVNYNYETIEKIVKSLIEKVQSDLQYGVNIHNIFFIKKNETRLKKQLFYEGKNYLSIEAEKDYSQIEATRYQVFRKSASNSTDAVYVSKVGYPDSDLGFQQIDIETETGIIEKKLILSEVLTNAEAKNYAYAKLTSQIIPLSIDVKGVDWKVYNPKPFELIQVNDKKEKIITLISDCDDLIGWNNAENDSIIYFEGTKSVKVKAVNSNYSINYIKKWNGLTKIIFMLKSSAIGENLKVNIYGFDSTLTVNAYNSGTYNTNSYNYAKLLKTITINSQNTAWKMIEIDIPESYISSIEFEKLSESQINIDRLQAYMYYTNQYQSNVESVKWKINTNNVNCDIKLNDEGIIYNSTIDRIDQRLNSVEGVQTV